MLHAEKPIQPRRRTFLKNEWLSTTLQCISKSVLLGFTSHSNQCTTTILFILQHGTPTNNPPRRKIFNRPVRILLRLTKNSRFCGQPKRKFYGWTYNQRSSSAKCALHIQMIGTRKTPSKRRLSQTIYGQLAQYCQPPTLTNQVIAVRITPFCKQAHLLMQKNADKKTQTITFRL